LHRQQDANWFNNRKIKISKNFQMKKSWKFFFYFKYFFIEIFEDIKRHLEKNFIRSSITPLSTRVKKKENLSDGIAPLFLYSIEI